MVVLLLADLGVLRVYVVNIEVGDWQLDVFAAAGSGLTVCCASKSFSEGFPRVVACGVFTNVESFVCTLSYY